MKLTIITLLAFTSLFANTDIFEKETQDCIVSQIKQQHSRFFTDTEIAHFAVFANDDENWEAILTTYYRDNAQASRSFVTVENGNYENSTLIIEGTISKSLDIRACFN